MTTNETAMSRRPALSSPRAGRAFFSAALLRQGTTGAIAPSSARLAAQLARAVSFERAGTRVVVELGPGSGAVTGHVTGRLIRGDRQLALEVNPRLVAVLQHDHPGIEVITGDARRLGALLLDRGVSRADSVVCGLPWGLFDRATQQTMLEQIATLLVPGGRFSTFAYLPFVAVPSARRFRALLHATFDTVTRDIVWSNLPPAVVYTCR